MQKICMVISKLKGITFFNIGKKNLQAITFQLHVCGTNLVLKLNFG